MTQSPINPAIFREYDIRGVAGKDLSSELAHRLGVAYAVYARRLLGKGPSERIKISVGRDCRLTGTEYAAALISGLRKAGVDVVALGVCPTPLTYFSIFHLKLDGGIMVTGSHNPPEYNGFKICVGKNTLHGAQIQELKKLVLDQPALEVVEGTLGEHPIIPDYINYVTGISQRLSGIKVVLDAGNGTAATVAPEVFTRLGADVVPLFCELDGRFPNHHPDPTEVKNLKHLIEAVKSNKADFGIAFDGDSDRIGAVDENGRVIFGDELLVVLSRALLKNNPGATIISEVKSSHRLYDDIRNHGGNAVMWKTGHSLIKSKMKETGALLAGEMSGHVFFADRYFGYDDAIYAAVRFAEIAVASEGPASSLLEGLPSTVTTPEIRVECEEEKKFELVENAKNELAKEFEINDIDGVRVDFGDGWGLLRASNTQPVLVMRFEAPTEDRLQEFRGFIEGALKRSAEKIGHGPIL